MQLRTTSPRLWLLTAALPALSLAQNQILSVEKIDSAAPPTNDSCFNAQVIDFGTFPGSTLSATPGGWASCGNSNTTGDIWYEFHLPLSDGVYVDTIGSDFDTVLSVRESCVGGSVYEWACNDDGAGQQSGLGVFVTAGTSYIRVSGGDGATGNVVLTLSSTGSSISGQVTRSFADPIEGFRIDRREANSLGYSGSTTTAADGTYTFSGLVPGSEWLIQARSSDELIGQLYSGLPCVANACDLGSGSVIALGSNHDITGVDFALEEGGTISGRLWVEGFGGGVGSQQVELYDQAGGYIGWVLTAPNGNFTFPSIVPGSYHVLANPSQHETKLWNDVDCPGGAGVGCDVVAEGAPIAVAASSDSGGINFLLAPLDRVFFDKFERGNLSKWSSSIP